MQDSWLEKYHQPRNHEGKSHDEFEAFIQLSEDPSVDFDTDDAWKKVNNRLGLSPGKKTFQLSTVWRVAAVFMLMALSMVLYLNISEGPGELMIITSKDGSLMHELPDGSTVFLHANSSISYEKAFKDRVVNFKGLAYYDVVKSGTTFTIKMNDLSLKVLGTAFSLEASDDQMKSYVEEGLVEVSNKSETQKVKPGELLTFNKAKNAFSLQQNADPNILSWKTGKFIFQNTPFVDVIQHLEKYYQIAFERPNQYKNCSITGQFNKREFGEVLAILSEVLNVEFQISKSKVKIIGKGCI